MQIYSEAYLIELNGITRSQECIAATMHRFISKPYRT